MARLTKDALLGANDIRTKEIDLETIGGSVVVQGLSASYSNEAQSEAVEMKQVGRDQVAKVNTVKMEAIQVYHGLVDPKLDSVEEAQRFLERCGPAAVKVVEAIDELSGLDKEAIAEAKAKFPSGGADAAGAVVGDGAPAGGAGPDLPVRDGAGDGEVDS